MTAVAIIGGGIAGLTAAHALTTAGLDVTLYEATERPGGMIRTERIDGYLVEYGPNTLQRMTPTLQSLVHALGLDDARVDARDEAKNRYVVRRGAPLALPSSPRTLLTSPLLSPAGKLRLLQEPFIRPAPASVEESVADFTRRRLGGEVLAYVVNPFVGGVFAGDPEQLSLRYAFPRLHALDQKYGSLFKGFLQQRHAAKRTAGAASHSRLFSFREGIGMLPDALSDVLGTWIKRRTPVEALRQTDDGTWHLALVSDGHRFSGRAEAVVYAAPLHRLPTLHFETASVLGPLAEVPYPPVSVLALGFRREDVAHPLDGFGMLVPQIETDFQILGTIFSSSLFPNRAPEGHVLLTTFVGGARHPQLALASADALQAHVLRDLRTLLGVRGKPTFAWHTRWTRAIPQYQLGYDRVQARIEALEKQHPGFFMAGNYRAGISVGDAMDSGDSAARHVRAYVTQRHAAAPRS